MRWTQKRAALISIMAALIVLAPIVRSLQDDPADGFPLSHFPMFSAKRVDTTRVTYLEGVTVDGRVVRLSYKRAGRGGLNQIRVQIKRLVREGKAETLCKRVAKRVAKRRDDVVEVRVIRGWFDMDRFFAGDRKPNRTKVKAKCRVKRG